MLLLFFEKDIINNLKNYKRKITDEIFYSHFWLSDE